MTLWTLVQACLMITNGVAVLNNERFLERNGWGFSQMGQFNSLKMSIIGGIHAAQYFRSLLVICNVVVIFIKLIFG
ncbi:Yos1-like protein [Dunaliella salina]|uniref:Yos1-like protein n=1 Tax=Dunaliella salina TaxID=3046 RepID=A0ABQ7H1J3_DUNSA|nr:Yos1-like protein [Dunaliella salina]|eukprot:KAF5840705.1 Yos1-like protein [Dunaliella salina]